MYKNQLQELAQRSCFNLPSYACSREGPDHAPRFTASVNFNGEIFQGPSHCTTLRQAEHAAAEVALATLSRSLAARVLDETGVYKNLLQETTHRAGLKLPVYTTARSGPGHQPVFASSVELAGMCIAGDPAKTKKQAEKNAAMAAWSSLKRDSEKFGIGGGEEQEQVVRFLCNLKPKEENGQARQRKKFVGFNYAGRSSLVSQHLSQKIQSSFCNIRARGIAPAVQIRSVIPVCAAPPRQPPAAVGPPASIANKGTVVDDISIAISKLHKLQL